MSHRRTRGGQKDAKLQAISPDSLRQALVVVAARAPFDVMTVASLRLVSREVCAIVSSRLEQLNAYDYGTVRELVQTVRPERFPSLAMLMLGVSGSDYQHALATASMARLAAVAPHWPQLLCLGISTPVGDLLPLAQALQHWPRLVSFRLDSACHDGHIELAQALATCRLLELLSLNQRDHAPKVDWLEVVAKHATSWENMTVFQYIQQCSIRGQSAASQLFTAGGAAWRELRFLHLVVHDLDSQAAAALEAAAPNWERLEGLTVSCKFDDALLRSLARAAPSWPQLKNFTLSGRLTDNIVPESAAATGVLLAAARSWAHLSTLQFEVYMRIAEDWTPEEQQAALQLVSSAPVWAELRELEIGCCRFSHTTAALLGQAGRSWEQLEELSITNCSFEHEEALGDMLASAGQHWQQLRRLDLSGATVSAEEIAETVEQLAALAPCWPRLEELDLRVAGLEAEADATLAGAIEEGLWPHLRRVVLPGGLGQEILAALAAQGRTSVTVEEAC